MNKEQGEGPPNIGVTLAQYRWQLHTTTTHLISPLWHWCRMLKLKLSPSSRVTQAWAEWNCLQERNRLSSRVTRDIRDTISRHIIPLPDQSRPLQSPPDMFRDEQSLRYPANRWNTGIICNICTGLLWRRRRILHPNYSQMILCGKHPSGPELCVPLQLYNIWYCGDIVTRNLNIEIWLSKTSLGKLKFCVVDKYKWF